MAARVGDVMYMFARQSFDSLNRAFQSDSDFGEDRTTVDHHLKKFLKKECSTFVPASRGGQQRCGCGRLKTEHEEDIKCNTDELWSSDKHTSQKPTDSFGLLSYSENEQDLGIASKYVRISDKTSPERVWSLLTEAWNLKSPTLVLSVLGGNGSGTVNSDIKHSVEEGLPKLVKAMKVWILTGATDTIDTSLISSSLLLNYHKRQEKFACIGIAPWGFIGWKEQLLGESSQVIYRPQNEGGTVKKNLCPNHTHFLLVDDGSINRFGTEQGLRKSLELFLTFTAIPVINLLIGGGFSACMHIKENVKASKRMQIIVIKGSGGLADVLEASLYQHDKRDCSGATLQGFIEEKIEYHMGLRRGEENYDTIASAVKEIVELHNTQILIFHPSGYSYGLHHAILGAAIASSKGSEQQDCLNRLQLAIHMDEFDVANHDFQDNHADAQLANSALYKAIKSGKSNFVQSFLKSGLNLREFIGEDKKMLKQLYFKTLKNDKFLTKLMSYSEQKEVFKSNSFDLKIVDRLLDYFMDEDYCSKIGEYQSMTPCQELMVWAVFNDMFEMVECFWKHETKQSLQNAVVVFRLYRSMSKKLKNIDGIKRQALRSHANTFEQRAVELLSLCYAEAPESTTELVATQMPLWGNQSLISLAANGRSRNFVSHICCQIYLEEIWRGKRELNKRRQRRIAWKKGNESVQLLDETDGGKERNRCPALFRHIATFLRFLLFVPKGKVVLHMAMYLIFLGCFAYKLLVKNKKASSSLWIYVIIFVAAVTIDKLCEILSMQKRTFLMKIKEWSHLMWKKIDMLAIILFYVGLGMTFKFDDGSRAVLALALVVWVIKFSQFYRMIQSLGPYLTMVYRMLLHMSSFIWVLLTVVVAFGVFLYSFLYSTEKLSWMIIFNLLFRPYLLVFGELGISSYSIGKTQTIFGTAKLDTARELIAVFGMCIYILVANVLLLNMLIAVFNNIYEDVKENSDRIWRFDRYHVIVEYSKKPSLPPPLSIISTLVRLGCMICSKCICLMPSGKSSNMDMLEMENLQHVSMREYLKADDQKSSYIVEGTLRSIKDKIEGNAKALVELNKKIDEKLSRIEALLEDNHHL